MTSFSKSSKLELDPDYKTLLDFIETKEIHNKNTFRVRKRAINEKYKTIVGVPHPFVKWAGGKRQLLSQFSTYLPKKFKKYIEPFVGGGALFFYLIPERAILIDDNWELINSYRVIQKKVDELITLLENHKNESEYYYKIRNVDRIFEEFKKWSDVERASRTIYLNRCCYNGLYRVNSSGYFNVPFGKYKNPKFCDSTNLKAVNQVLQDTEIINASFETCLNYAEKDDFIYLDPPYQPLTKTANFTGYTKNGFSETSQYRLNEVYRALDGIGCKVMLSNSYNEFILDLYQDFKVITVEAKRAINSNAARRGEIKEIIILNYDVPYC